jgi:hypothetical protein
MYKPDMRKMNQTILFIYSLVVTLLLLADSIYMVKISNPARKSFEEIDAQQIRIMEPDGTLRMIISNHHRFPGIIVHGKEQPFDRPQAGMLFYNDEASENGGLIFGGLKNKDGEIINSGGSLSFDRYGGNEELRLIGVNDKDDRFAGLGISDSHPESHTNSSRIWVGRNDDGSAEISLKDSSGKNRLVFTVLGNGKSSVNFLDDNGKIVMSIGPGQKIK